MNLDDFCHPSEYRGDPGKELPGVSELGCEIEEFGLEEYLGLDLASF